MIEPSQLEGLWAPLEERAVFRITGPDRVRYLNGQVSNDVSGPLDREAIAACLCSIKGKVDALVWISASGESLMLDGELKQREMIHARLQRYLIADDCEIHDETGQWQLIHHFMRGMPGVASRRLSVPGYDWLAPIGESNPFDEGRIIPAGKWNELALLSLLPESGKEITGAEFPAELGLDSWAVSFRKGCYLGQEIISRIKSVGKIRRTLRLIWTESPVDAGSAVGNEIGERGRTTRESIAHPNFFFLSAALF